MAKNDALMKLTTERIANNSALAEFVNKAKALTIPLFPETMLPAPPEMSYGAAIISVDTAVDGYGNNRDIYKNESGSYCLHLTKINEIAQQSGLSITDSRVLEHRRDNEGGVTYILHQVSWEYASIDGTTKKGVSTGEYDYYRDCSKYIKPGEYKTDKQGRQILKDGKPVTKGEDQVKQRRGHAGALAESKAKYRAFNEAIAKLPRNFSLDELQKPFLVPFVIKDTNALLNQLTPDMRDSVRADYVRKQLGLAEMIYGTPDQLNAKPQQAQPIQLSAKPEDTTTDISEAQVVTEEVLPDGLTVAELIAINVESLMSAPQKERTEKAVAMAVKHGVKNADGTSITAEQFERNKPEMQRRFLNLVLTKEQTSTEDLPC